MLSVGKVITSGQMRTILFNKNNRRAKDFSKTSEHRENQHMQNPAIKTGDTDKNLLKR